MQKLVKLFHNPKKYINLAFKIMLQKLCSPMQKTAFYLQGQMDINPKSRWNTDHFRNTTGGFYPENDNSNRTICNLEPWDNTRRDMLVLLLRTVVTKNIAGDMAELGVYKGQTAKLFHYYLPERKLHLFDTFAGFTDRSVAIEKKNTDFHITESQFADTSLEHVKDFISPKNSNVLYYKGYFPESLPEHLHKQQFAFVHLDADLYEPTLEGLKFFYPRMSTSGIIVVHDYNAWFGARKAIDDFFADKKELAIPMPDKSGSVIIVKQ